MITSFRKVAASCAAGLALLAGGAGIAYAAIPDSGGVFHGCAGQVGGYLRVIDTGSCISTETALSWGSGFTDWAIVTGSSDTLTSVWSDITASCDYANGYRLMYATAQRNEPAYGEGATGVVPYQMLHATPDGRPTGVEFKTRSPGNSPTTLDWQLSCVK